MFEREAGTAAVARLLDQAHRGRGGALFVIGEAGLGKTSLLDQACLLAGPSVRLGVARGDVMETALPFGLVAQVIERLCGKDVLAAIVASAPQDTRATKFFSALRAIEDLSAETPVVLALDDVHWADPDSLDLLSFLCRRIAVVPAVVVATLRPWPPAAEDLCLRLVASGHAAVERLEPLSAAATAALLADTLGHALPTEIVDQAFSLSSGNPLLLEQVALAIDRGDPVPDPAIWRHAPEVALVLGRFAGLPDAGLRCARAASVLGDHFRSELAAAMARLDHEEAELALEAMSRSGMVRRTGVGTAEFAYRLFRQALYDSLSPLVRDELHGRAFELLMDRGLEAEAEPHAVRSNLAGNRTAVGVLERAGRAALTGGAVATAVERLQGAVDLAGNLVSIELLLVVGEALLADTRVAAAIGVYTRVLGHPALSPSQHTEALRMLGRALIMSGDRAEGGRRFEEAAELAATHDPAAAVQAVLDHSRAAWLTEGPRGALPLAERAREMSRTADATVRAQADAAWGFVAFVSGDARGVDADLASSPVTPSAADRRDLWWNWGTLRNRGRAAKYAERFEEADRVFTTTFAHATRSGAHQASASLAAHHADTLARRGLFDQARELVAKAVVLAELSPMAAAFARVAEASVLLQTNRVAESEVSCRLAEVAASACQQWLPMLRVWHLRAWRLLREGELDEACALYARIEAETSRLGIREPCLVPWARHGATAYLRRGRRADAERILEWVRSCAGQLPCRWPRIAVHTIKAALVEASDDGAAGEVEHLAALALHDGLELPVEHVETLLAWGAFLRRAGRRTEARDALGRAHAIIDRTGAIWLAPEVDQELAVAGGPRRGRQSAPQSLTAQEQRVAAMAGAGQSCNEIARQLSLSPRTIETHLRRVYAKLGIHSQRELMARSPSTPIDREG